MLEGSIVCALRTRREAASRQFPHLQVVAKALATDSFFAAGLISAVATREVFFLIAFHFTSFQIDGFKMSLFFILARTMSTIY